MKYLKIMQTILKPLNPIMHCCIALKFLCAKMYSNYAKTKEFDVISVVSLLRASIISPALW